MIGVLVLLVLTAVILTAPMERSSASTAPGTDAYGSVPTGQGQASGHEPIVADDDRAQEILAIVALGAGFTVVTGGRAYLARRSRDQGP